MGKSRPPELPLYDLYSDNIYQINNRQLAKNLGAWLNNNYDTIDATSDAYRANQDAYIGNYNNMVRNTLAKNYSGYDNARALGRANTGLYNTDMGSLYNDDLNTRVSSANAQQYGSLANQYFNNQMANLAARYMQYVPSGEDINAVDYVNNNITNQNKDREYQNQMIRDMGKANPWNIVKSTAEGAMKGGQWGGPWGAVAGTAAGFGQGFANEYTDIGWANNGKGLTILEKVPGKGVFGGFGRGSGGFSGFSFGG